MSVAQFEVVKQAKDPRSATGQIALYDADGNNIDVGGGGDTPAYTLPAATAAALGGVKQVEFGDAIGRGANAAAATGDTVSVATYNALVTAHNNLLTEFNRLIGGLETAGVIKRPAAA